MSKTVYSRGLDLVVVVACAVVLVFMWRMQERLAAAETRGPSAASSARPPASIDTVEVAARGVLIGDPAAPVTIVQFTDYQCPFCKRFNDETLPTLMADYIATGAVKLLIRDLPLPIHPGAKFLATAARCGEDLELEAKAVQDVLYGLSGDSIEAATVRQLERLGGSRADIRSCLEEPRHQQEIGEDIAEAGRVGVRGTPAFVIGTSGSSIKGVLIRGAVPAEQCVQAIQNVSDVRGSTRSGR